MNLSTTSGLSSGTANWSDFAASDFAVSDLSFLASVSLASAFLTSGLSSAAMRIPRPVKRTIVAATAIHNPRVRKLKDMADPLFIEVPLGTGKDAANAEPDRRISAGLRPHHSRI